MINRNFTNISCKALGQLISLKDAASRSVSKNAVFNPDSRYYIPAIRLFIALNFLVSTRDGKATNIIIKELAEEIHCCKKTVISSLEKLASGSDPLISYCIDEETKLLSIEILNYTNMFKRTGEGGLRYLVFDKDLKSRFFMLKNINEMRVCIRAFLECIEQDGYEASLSVKQFLKALPNYLRPCNIKAYLKILPVFIKSQPNINSTSYHLSVNTLSRAKEIREKKYAENESKIRKVIEDFNEQINFINNYNSGKENPMNTHTSIMISDLLHVNFDWKKAQECKQKELPTFHFTSKEYEDAAQIATQLDFKSVKIALSKYMETFVLTGRGSTRRDTMAIIQNISEAIFTKLHTYFDSQTENYNDFESFDFNTTLAIF